MRVSKTFSEFCCDTLFAWNCGCVFFLWFWNSLSRCCSFLRSFVFLRGFVYFLSCASQQQPGTNDAEAFALVRSQLLRARHMHRMHCFIRDGCALSSIFLHVFLSFFFLSFMEGATGQKTERLQGGQTGREKKNGVNLVGESGIGSVPALTPLPPPPTMPSPNWTDLKKRGKQGLTSSGA